MDEQISKAKQIRKFLSEVITSVFACAVLGATISGWVISSFADTELPTYSGFFSLYMGGMSYGSIIQLFGLSVVLGILLLIFISDIFLEKILLLRRYMFFLISALIAISLFVLVFGWFPPDAWQGWVAVWGSFAVFSCVSMIPAFIKARREDREYEKALSDYKAKRGKG